MHWISPTASPLSSLSPSYGSSSGSVAFLDFLDVSCGFSEVVVVFGGMYSVEVIVPVFFGVVLVFTKRVFANIIITMATTSTVSSIAIIPFTVGGGIRSVDDFNALLRAGADKVSVNSAAIRNPALIQEAADKFGSQCVVCAIDAKRRSEGGWTVYLNGGRVDTGLDAVKWAKQAVELGAGEILLTSMDCDGVKNGYDLELTRAVSECVHVPVIASGGAGKMEHFYDAFTQGQADAVLAASLFHFGEITIPELKGYLAGRGISVRQ